MKNALEVVIYKIKGDVSDADFIREATSMEEHFAKKQKGFIKRTFGKGEGKNEWVDVIYWDTMDSAMKASEAAMKSTVCAPMFGMLDEASVKMFHFEILSQ